MLAINDSGGYTTAQYDLIGVVATFRVNQNNTTTAIVEITARSKIYDVQYTWDVLKTTFDGAGAKALAETKTEQVNAIAAVAHVQALRSEKDQDNSDLLYNYLVVTVGTPDLAITTDVSIRMDQIGTPGAFQAIDDAWNNLIDLGAPAA